MKALWDRLEAHAQKHGRSLRLRPGAAEADIAAVEQTLGITLPAEYRESLLLHDGQDGTDSDNPPFEWMPGCGPLASIKAIPEQWTFEQDNVMDYEIVEATPAIFQFLAHPKRIPIAGNQFWDGDNTSLDLTPAPAGTVGQIITLYTECDHVLLGASFRIALENYLAALDSGDWIYDPALGHTRHKDQPPDTYPHESLEFSKWLEATGRVAPAS